MTNNKDYYKILHLTEEDKKLSNDEFSKKLKSSYRQLSKKYHPDIEGGSEEKFKEINEAYEILGDSQSRAGYDNPQFGINNPFQGTQFEDLFQNFFNRGAEQRRRAPDKVVELEIGVLESYTGIASKVIKYERNYACEECSGKGGDKTQCSTCNGSGYRTQRVGNQFVSQIISTPCTSCSGNGFTISNACKKCSGKGYNAGTENLTISIPKGVDTGNYMKVPSYGDYQEGIFGDLVLKIKIIPEGNFEKNGNDLIYNQFFDLKELNTITSLSIPHPSGELSIKLPEDFNTSIPLRVNGKGFAGGDLYIKLIVKFKRSK